MCLSCEVMHLEVLGVERCGLNVCVCPEFKCGGPMPSVAVFEDVFEEVTEVECTSGWGPGLTGVVSLSKKHHQGQSTSGCSEKVAVGKPVRNSST